MRRRLTAVLGLVGFLGKGVAIYMILTEMMVVTSGSLIRNILRWECLDFNANLLRYYFDDWAKLAEVTGLGKNID